MTAPAFPIATQIIGLFAWMVITFVAASVGGLGSANAEGFYQQLDRPGWAPPASVFGPVWTTLYALMAVAAWLVWRARGFAGARGALLLFCWQLVFNALWSWLFFAWQRGALALADVVLLWLLIGLTIRAFWSHRALAGVLLLPYLAWVTFAAVLTWTLWQRNPQLL